MATRLTCLFSAVLLLLMVGATRADLVSRWTFDEGTGTQVYDIVGSNHGTAEGDPTWIAGVYGGAMEFHGSGSADNTGDRINCGSDASLNIGGEVSLALWIRPDAEDPEGAGMETAPMCKALSSASPSWTFQVRYGWGGPQRYMAFTFNTSPRAWAFVGQDLEQGEWCHIACSYDGSTLTTYLNGEATESTAMGAVTNSPTPVLIGSDGWGSDWIGGIDDVRYYNNYLTAEEIVEVMLDGAGPELASAPAPENEAVDVLRDAVLSWTPGEFAASHDVYLGTVFDDVNDASRGNPMDILVSQGQAAATYDAGRLAFGQTYYWRIDEVNAAPDNTIFKGQVWSFTTEPLAFPIEGVVATTNATSDAGAGIENIVNGSGLDENGLHSTSASDMWLGVAGADPIGIEFDLGQVYKLHEMRVWNYNVEFELILGFGLKDVTVEYSNDGAEWMSLGNVELTKGTARAGYAANTMIDFQGAAARYVRLTVNSGWGMMGQYGLSEVRFLAIPVQAQAPQPADGDTDVSVGATLTWRAGREAAVHEVYLSTNGEAVVDGTALAGTVNAASFTPGDLQFGTRYYWKINEVNDAEAITSWESGIWTFLTSDYAWIDDFETYDDEENRIYDTWLDGWINDTGSTVGYLEAPFAEETIVNGGAQSMPLSYDNSVAPFYSEAEKDLGGMDLTGNGADTLVVNFRGNAPGFYEANDGRIMMNGTGVDVWGTTDEFRYAYMRLSGNGSITARVDYVMNTSAWAKAGVMIRAGLDAGSTHAMTVLTPGNGVALQNRPVMNQTSYNVNEVGLVAPYWVRLTRSGNSFTGERSADGVNWVSITADTAASTVQINMAADVYIGLMASSINVNAIGAATFSNVSTTGNVTGNWQIAEIGVKQPAGNTPESLYVALEDSSGSVRVVTHPDPLATALTEWQEWQIPYSALSGVNLRSVRTVYIGMGDRNNPTAGDTGLVYIDDVGFGRVYTEPADAAAAGDIGQGAPNDGN